MRQQQIELRAITQHAEHDLRSKSRIPGIELRLGAKKIGSIAAGVHSQQDGKSRAARWGGLHRPRL